MWYHHNNGSSSYFLSHRNCCQWCLALTKRSHSSRRHTWLNKLTSAVVMVPSEHLVTVEAHLGQLLVWAKRTQVLHPHARRWRHTHLLWRHSPLRQRRGRSWCCAVVVGAVDVSWSKKNEAGLLQRLFLDFVTINLLNLFFLFFIHRFHKQQLRAFMFTSR